MNNRLDILRPFILAVALWTSMPALSAERRADPQALPGVKDDFRIVKPMAPEPEAEPRPAIKVDGWEVSASGSVTVDITTAGLPLRRH